MGAVAKSYMMNGFLIYKDKYLVAYEEAVSHIDFLTAPFWISLYVRKSSFSFSSVYGAIFRGGMAAVPTDKSDITRCRAY